jgi:hypothetical protein
MANSVKSLFNQFSSLLLNKLRQKKSRIFRNRKIRDQILFRAQVYLLRQTDSVNDSSRAEN